jgi:hypothetical protein
VLVYDKVTIVNRGYYQRMHDSVDQSGVSASTRSEWSEQLDSRLTQIPVVYNKSVAARNQFSTSSSTSSADASASSAASCC